MSLIVCVLLILSIVIASVFAVNKISENVNENDIFSSRKIKVMALVGKDWGSLNKSDKKIISSFPKEMWLEWSDRLNQLIIVSTKYADVMSAYILQYYSYVSKQPHFCEYKLFSPVANRCKVLLECMRFEDILHLSMITEDDWQKRQRVKKIAESICLNNTDAIREIKITKQPLLDEDIVRLDKRIQQIQKRYVVASEYKTWIKKQSDYCDTIFNLYDGSKNEFCCYQYEVAFKRPLPSGAVVNDSFNIYQFFYDCESPFYEEQQKQLNFHMVQPQTLQKFKDGRWHCNDAVYDEIVAFIKMLSDGNELLVVFNNHTAYKWSDGTYNFHYAYLKSCLEKTGVPYINIEQLASIADGFDYGSIFVFDLITVNEDLLLTSKLIAEVFSIKVPTIVWCSLIKEFDKDEMEELCKLATKDVSQ